MQRTGNNRYVTTSDTGYFRTYFPKPPSLGPDRLNYKFFRDPVVFPITSFTAGIIRVPVSLFAVVNLRPCSLASRYGRTPSTHSLTAATRPAVSHKFVSNNARKAPIHLPPLNGAVFRQKPVRAYYELYTNAADVERQTVVVYARNAPVMYYVRPL